MSHKDFWLREIKTAVAIWRRKSNGIVIGLMPSTPVGFFQKVFHDPTRPEMAHRAFDFTPTSITWLAEDASKGEIEFLKTPATPYHVWHICYCPECNGRVWSHSQGDWDNHLRYVDPRYIGSLPSIEPKSPEEIYKTIYNSEEGYDEQ